MAFLFKEEGTASFHKEEKVSNQPKTIRNNKILRVIKSIQVLLRNGSQYISSALQKVCLPPDAGLSHGIERKKNTRANKTPVLKYIHV
jgi:hypothetical protein